MVKIESLEKAEQYRRDGNLVADLIDEYRIENNERGLGMLDVEPTADQILALVTNYIKELPSMQLETALLVQPIHPFQTDETQHQQYKDAMNRDSVRQSIIKEVEEL